MTTTEPRRTTPEVGDILRSTWGYDQTNVDYYQVTRITPSGLSIGIRPIGYATRENTGEWAQDYVTPAPGNFIGPEKLKRAKPHYDGDGYQVRITSYSNAYGPHNPAARTLQTSYA